MVHVTWSVVTYSIFHIWLWGYGYCSVPLGAFYDAGNSNCLSYRWNQLRVDLTTEFDFFEDKYRSVWVLDNGILIFGDYIYPDRRNSFPGPGAYLAPFWMHYRCMVNTQKTCWREVASEQELGRAGEEIASYFPELMNFNVSWIFIVSWINVTTCYPSNWTPPPFRNTFQAVLVTDGVLTFVIYNYNKIQYTTHWWHIINIHAEVGYNKGDDTNVYAVEGSGREDIETVVSRSNVNRTGTFVFRLNGYMTRPVKVAYIVFVIDSSHSETSLFGSALQYVVDVTDSLTIAPNETQVAVVSFSGTARVEFDFLFCQNKDCVHERVLNISHINSTSYMETGLALASDLWTRGGRQSALKYVVVVSDGLVNRREAATRQARNLNSVHSGVKVVSVGLGRSVYHTVLEGVAFNSSYLLAPDPGKLLDLLQWELHDRNITGCENKYSADMLIVVETSASHSDNTLKTVLNFLQTFLDQINSHHINNTVTISIATHDTSTHYVIRECRLSNLQYMMDAIKELRQSHGKLDWESVMTFVDVHTSYSNVGTWKYVMFVTTGLIPEESLAHVKTQLVYLRDNNGVSVVMVGVADHTDWTVLEHVYDCGFYTFSTEDVDIASRVLWNDIKSTNCTRFEKNTP